MKPTRQARIAYIVSLWPFVLFTFSLGITLLIMLTIVVDAESFRVTVLTPFGIFVFLTIMGPMTTAPPLLSSLAPAALISALVGTTVGLVIRASTEDKEMTRIATRAALFGLASFGMFAFLFWWWSGFGR